MNANSARTEVADALLSLGITNEPEKYDDGIHSWRCGHPERYGRCTCFDDAVSELVSIDWRVLGGVIPGPIPAEWARQGDTIRDNGVTGTITRIVNTGPMVHLYIDSGHVCFAKVTRQDWVHVINAGEETS